MSLPYLLRDPVALYQFILCSSVSEVLMQAWMHRTRAGPVYIVPRHGRFHVVYDDQGLGSYHSPRAAADDVAGGHTFTPSNGVDLGELGISYDLVDWEVVSIR